MDPLTIASLGLQLGTTLDQASSAARQENKMAQALRIKKAELTTRNNINILNRQTSGERERSNIASSLQSSGFANADSQMLSVSMNTEITDIANMNRELAWEKNQADQQISLSNQKAEAAKKGGMYSSLGILASYGASEYKNNPSFEKSINDWWDIKK
jgi:hypothetical protein